MNTLTWHQGGIAIMAFGLGTLIFFGAFLCLGAVIRWWRDGRDRLERTRRQAALDQAVADADERHWQSLQQMLGNPGPCGDDCGPDCNFGEE